MSNSKPKPQRRPPTQTIKRVVDWMASQGLQVYGPGIDFDRGVQCSGCMDYTVPDMLRLAKLRKKHPDGIPESHH